MRKSTLSIALILCLSSAANAQTPKFSAKNFVSATKPKKEVREPHLIAKPQHETVYAPDGDGGWTKDYENTYTYDEHGNILTLVTDDGKSLTKVENTYDEKGQLLTETTYRTNGDDKYEPRMKKEYSYDPEIFDLATSFVFSTISNGEWTPFPGSCYKRVVERNADGNITSVTKQVLDYDGKYSNQSKIVFTFGEGEKQPSGYEYLIANNGEFSTYTKYTDMVWDRFTPPLASAYSLSWFMDGNFLKSATVKDNTYGDITLSATADDKGNFEVWNVYAGMKSQKQKLKYEKADNNGSFRFYNLVYYNTDGDEATEDDLYSGTTMYVDYDVWGNELVYEERQVNQFGLENAQITDGVKNEFVYGGPHGEVSEAVTYSFDANESKYVLSAKVESDNFTDVMVGIENVKADTKTAPQGVYNMQGMKLGNDTRDLPKGIYIVNGKKILK